MKVTQKELALVQDLYLLQVDLQQKLQSGVQDPKERKEARKQAKEFSAMLQQVDWRCMGGEDVLQSLRETEQEVMQKLR
ncbi:MAG: hypothetical protein WCX29_02110 [Candidatus Peribacteraceae bacterium]|nr:hypothetical protein [Candidatus Peribacteria bacterium]